MTGIVKRTNEPWPQDADALLFLDSVLPVVFLAPVKVDIAGLCSPPFPSTDLDAVVPPGPNPNFDPNDQPLDLHAPRSSVQEVPP